jgi:O-antigen/teichoic acid export membrane protein
MSNFLRDFTSIGFSKGVMIISGLTTSIIIARVLGPEKNGLIASLLVYPGLFMTIGSLGISQSTTYFIGKSIYTDEQVKRAITQIWFFSTFVSLISCFLLIRYLSNSGENLMYIMLALSPIPFSLFNTYNSGYFLGKNQIRTFNKINWIPSVVILVSTVMFILIFPMGINGYLIALTGGPLFIAVLLIFKNKFFKSFSIKVDWKIIRKMLSLGFVYALALLVMNLNYRLDIILLDLLSTNFETGIYSKGSNITQHLWQIPMLMGTIVFARSAVSKDGLAFSKKIAQLLRLSFLAISAASIVLVFFSDIIIIGLFGEEFRESISVLNYLMPGVILLTIFKVMNMDLAGKGKPWVSLFVMAPALIINVILNFLLIPKYQADGAAIASTISYACAGIAFLFLYSKSSKISVKEIITYKKSDFDPIFEIIKKIRK